MDQKASVTHPPSHRQLLQAVRLLDSAMYNQKTAMAAC